MSGYQPNRLHGDLPSPMPPKRLRRVNAACFLLGGSTAGFAAGNAPNPYLATFAFCVMIVCFLALGVTLGQMWLAWETQPAKPASPDLADVVALSNEAEQARAHAVKYDLPTAVWDGLGAMWDAIAEQDAETAGKTAETPTQRPASPKGGGAASKPYADRQRLHEVTCETCTQSWTAETHRMAMDSMAVHRLECVARKGQPWLVQGEVAPGHEQQLADTLTASSLPKVTATTPPSDKVRVDGMLVSIAPTSTVGRTDLVVRRLLGRASWQFLVVHDVRDDTIDLAKEERGLNDCQLLARVVMPPNTSTVQQAQITDLRDGDDTVTVNALSDEINRMKAELLNGD